MKVFVLILTLIALAIMIGLSPQGEQKANVLWASAFIVLGMFFGGYLWGRCRRLAFEAEATNQGLQDECERLERGEG